MEINQHVNAVSKNNNLTNNQNPDPFLVDGSLENISDLIDESRIKNLLNRWVFYRDKMDMINFNKVWSSDGSMHVGFFEGEKDSFMKLIIEKNLDSRHFLSEPLIKICKERAIAKTYCLLLVRSEKPYLDIFAHIQFYDLLIKESENWKLFKRYVVFIKDRLDFVRPGPVKMIIYSLLNLFFLRRYPKNAKHLHFVWKKVFKLDIPKYHPIAYNSREEEAVVRELDGWTKHKETQSYHSKIILADLVENNTMCQ